MRRAVLAVRLGLLAALAWLGIRHLTDEEFWSPFAGVTFGVHELGHLFFSFLGEWMSVAGGSIAQVLLPLAAALYFWRVRRDRYAVAVCGTWLAMSLANLAVYIGDARAESLDLMSFSEDGAVHDWNYLLHTLGLIRRDREIAGFARLVGWLVLGGSVVVGGRASLQAARGEEAEVRP